MIKDISFGKVDTDQRSSILFMVETVFLLTMLPGLTGRLYGDW